MLVRSPRGGRSLVWGCLRSPLVNEPDSSAFCLATRWQRPLSWTPIDAAWHNQCSAASLMGPLCGERAPFGDRSREAPQDRKNARLTRRAGHCHACLGGAPAPSSYPRSACASACAVVRWWVVLEKRRRSRVSSRHGTAAPRGDVGAAGRAGLVQRVRPLTCAFN